MALGLWYLVFENSVLESGLDNPFPNPRCDSKGSKDEASKAEDQRPKTKDQIFLTNCQFFLFIRKLQFIQPPVLSALGQQLRVAPCLSYSAAFHDNDCVGAANGRQTMGDNDRRSVSHQVCDCLLYKTFRFRIEGGGRFIQNQHWSV